MKAKDILNLCEESSLTPNEARQLTLEYFLKKFKVIGADVSRMETLHNVRIEYPVSQTFYCGSIKKIDDYTKSLGKSFGSKFKSETLYNPLRTSISPAPLFHVGIMFDHLQSRVRIDILCRFETYFQELRKESIDISEVNEVYKLIDLMVKVFRLVTPE